MAILPFPGFISAIMLVEIICFPFYLVVFMNIYYSIGLFYACASFIMLTEVIYWICPLVVFTFGLFYACAFITDLTELMYWICPLLVLIIIIGCASDMMLRIAAELGHYIYVHQLLQVNDTYINVADAQGCTPLILAARGGHVRVVELLLRHERIDIAAE